MARVSGDPGYVRDALCRHYLPHGNCAASYTQLGSNARHQTALAPQQIHARERHTAMLSPSERSWQALNGGYIAQDGLSIYSAPLAMDVAQVVRDARSRAGMSQRDLAKRLGVAPSAVAQWETSVTLPSIARRVELSRLLGIPFGDLMPEAKATGEGALRDPQMLAIVQQLLKLPQPVREAVLMQAAATVEALEGR